MFALQYVGKELRSSARARGTAVGAVAVAAARSAGVDLRAAIACGAVVATLEASAVDRHNRAAREVRNAAERVSLTNYAEPALFFGEGAVDADFARLVVDAVRRTSGDIVELGAGVSTALIAQAVRGTTRRVWTIEHDRAWAAVCESRLDEATLSEHVTLLQAPLVPGVFDGYQTAWYDRSVLDAVPGGIGLLVVDGPPHLGGRERWPALEVLADRLRPDAVVLADDGRRRHETLMVRRWSARSGLSVRWVDTAKGAWVLQREERPRVRGAALKLARLFNPRPVGHGLAAVPR